MTPQLRQAIKLLQFSNLEAAAFVEEELERNPLLERDESAEAGRPSARRPTSVVVAATAGDRPMRADAAVRGGRCRGEAPRRWMPTTPRPTTRAAPATAS